MIAKPENDIPDTTGQSCPWRSSVPHISSATKSHLLPPSIEELETHRKWRRAALVFYGSIAISTFLLLIAINPPSQTAAKNNPAYSAIAARGQNKSP